jgi:low temperature requirement protein LtrA
MNKQDIENKQLFIIDGQLIGSIIYIVTIIISIIIILNQRKKVLGKDEFLNSKESQTLALISRILIVLIILWLIYTNYKAKDLAKKTNQYTSSLELQIISSIILLIPALIGLYVVITDFSNTNLQTAEIENPVS